MFTRFPISHRLKAVTTSIYESRTTSHTSLTTINAAIEKFEKNKNPEDKNHLMQILAHAFVSFKDNHEIQNKIQEFEEKHTDFWMPHQSFEAYINTLHKSKKILCTNPKNIFRQFKDNTE